MCDPWSWNHQGQCVVFSFSFLIPVHRLSSSWRQRAARYTDPSPCRRPPCTREVWAPTAVPRTACRPIAIASPATPTPSWAPRRPATTWTPLVTGSPRRSVQATSACLCERSSFLYPCSPAAPPPPPRTAPNTVIVFDWKLKFRNSMFSKITASVGFFVRLPKPWIYFSYSKLLHL